MVVLLCAYTYRRDSRERGPWYTDFGIKFRVLPLPEMYRLPVCTYIAIATPEIYYITQKAGYRRHGDTLPLLAYHSEESFLKISDKQKCTRILFRREKGSGTKRLVGQAGLEPAITPL